MKNRNAELEPLSNQRHPLDERVELRRSRINEFAQAYPDLWQVFEICIGVAQMLMLAVGHLPEISLVETHRLTMWQSVLNYQVQSLLLILEHEIDAGLALLRLAAELSRDVYCIDDDESRLNLWFEKETRAKEYRSLFRFDESSAVGTIVKDIYKFCSKFGVHGHTTNYMHSEPIGFAGDNETLLLIDVSEYGVLDAVRIWLSGFVPMHHLCARRFLVRHSLDLQEEFACFANLEIAISDVVKELSKSLQSLKQDQVGA